MNSASLVEVLMMIQPILVILMEFVTSCRGSGADVDGSNGVCGMMVACDSNFRDYYRDTQ